MKQETCRSWVLCFESELQQRIWLWIQSQWLLPTGSVGSLKSVLTHEACSSHTHAYTPTAAETFLLVLFKYNLVKGYLCGVDHTWNLASWEWWWWKCKCLLRTVLQRASVFDPRGLFFILVKESSHPSRKLLINLFGKATLLRTWEFKSLGLKPRWTPSLKWLWRGLRSSVSGEFLVKRGGMPNVPSWAIPQH